MEVLPSNYPYGCNIVFDRNRFFESRKGMRQRIYFCIIGKLRKIKQKRENSLTESDCEYPIE